MQISVKRQRSWKLGSRQVRFDEIDEQIEDPLYGFIAWPIHLSIINDMPFPHYGSPKNSGNSRSLYPTGS